MAKNWNKSEVDTLIRCVKQKMDVEHIATALNRPANAIYLKAYRMHLPLREMSPRPIMRQMMEAKFRDVSLFVANRDFYDAVGISQKRWPALLYGYETPTNDELRSVARYLRFEVTDYERFILNEQLEMF